MAKQPLPPDADDEEEFDPRIDELQLDKEWLRQPDMYWRWSKRKAEANRTIAHAKNNLAAVTAELTREIRTDPASYGLDKVVDSTVAAALQEQPPIKKATQQVIDAQYRADIIGAAIAALDQRRRALQDLVSLHSQNYFSAPRARPGTEDAVKEIEQGAARRAWGRVQEAEEE